MKRVMFGFAWFIVFLLVSVLALGILIGDPAQDVDAASQAGQAFGHTYGRYVVLGALVAAVGGSYFRVLPGTKQSARRDF